MTLDPQITAQLVDGAREVAPHLVVSPVVSPVVSLTGHRDPRGRPMTRTDSSTRSGWSW